MPTPQGSSFAEVLREYRLIAGLTQEALAERAGISARTIRLLEHGGSQPHADTAQRLATALALVDDRRQQFLAAVRPAPRQRPGSPPWAASRRVPLEPTRLLGREQELAVVLALLQQDDIRLLTLTGPGGVGKTRLALEAARQVQEQRVDEVVFVNLAPLTNPTLVAPTIAQVLGVKEQPGQALLDGLRAYLRARQMLLVLDNFEQVTAAAPLLPDLLRGAAHLTLLVTSRAALQLSGEQEYPVPPLPLPPPGAAPTVAELPRYAAVALFVARAQAVRLDFQLTPENVPAVAEICVALDGLPLAIELAAARIRIFPPETLRTRLASRLQALIGGARDLPARQQTLRATIDWSYQLLAGTEQTLLARLAVFVGGCTLEAAEVICRTETGSALDVDVGLEALVRQSLVVSQGDEAVAPRFGLLATVREYALERLELSGEVAAVRDRHLRYFRALAEEAAPHLETGAQLEWLARLDTEVDNLRAALAWAVEGGTREEGMHLATALQHFWTMRSHFQEAYRWWQRLRARPAELPASLAAQALTRGALFAWYSGHHGEVVPLAEAGMALSREIGDRRSLILALVVLGLMEHNYVRRLRLQEEEEQVARELGAPWWLAGAFWNKGMTLEGHDDVGARSAYEEAAELYRSGGDLWGRVWMLTAVARYAQREGQDETVTALLEESMTLAQRLGDRSTIAHALRGLGTSAYRQGNLERARHLLGESLAGQEEAGNRPITLEVLAELGQVALAQGDLEQATAMIDEALASSRSLGEPRGIARALRLAGLLARARGQSERAREVLRESLTHARELDVYLVVEVIESLAGVLAAGVLAARGVAARLWGATSMVREAQIWPLPPVARGDYDRDVALARAQLGEAAFEAAWTEGRAMTLEQAVTYALQEAA